MDEGGDKLTPENASTTEDTPTQKVGGIKKKMSRIQKLKADAGAKKIPKYPWDKEDEFDNIERAETPSIFKESESQRVEAFANIQEVEAENPHEDQLKNQYPWGNEYKESDDRSAKEIYKKQRKKKKMEAKKLSSPKGTHNSREDLIGTSSRGFYKFGLLEGSTSCCLSLIATICCPWCAMDHVTHAVKANISEESTINPVLENLSYYFCCCFPCVWSCTGMLLFQTDQRIDDSFGSRLAVATCCLPCELNREYRQLVKLGRIHPDIIKLRNNCFFWDFDNGRFESDCCGG